MNPNPEIWATGGAALVAVLSGLIAMWTARSTAKRVRQVEDNKLDITKAEFRYRETQDLITNLRYEVKRLKNEVEELRQLLERERQEKYGLRELVRQRTEVANNLQHKVLVLQQQLGSK